MSVAIEVNNLTHYYGKKMVFEGLNFQVKEGQILGLLGKNGVGKSTIINILNGFLQPTSGQALIYSENTQHLSAATKGRIGFLIEGHVQYSFMTIHQIERFYSQCYPQWKPEPYWDLMNKLNVAPKQKISQMSQGQRSQVVLGLILAQDPDLLILDDFSMGLDPGYRRLFIDYLRDYTKSEGKTVFTTSHIIQDMERLIDDVLIMDHDQILAQGSVSSFMQTFKQYRFDLKNRTPFPEKLDWVSSFEQRNNAVEIYTYSKEADIKHKLLEQEIEYNNFKEVELTLEDAFIGLTGKY